MITFLVCLAALVIGYLVYGRIVERVFRPDDRETPAVAIHDGVDFNVLPVWRAFLIQLLNIAGTGPIFGALMGAVFGPVVLVWIVLGSILGGAVHDYMTGMISLRMNGVMVGDIVEKTLGRWASLLMRVFSVVLMILVGTVFTSSPAELLARLTPEWMDANFWVAIILIYYLLATLLPIDALIAKFYPFFGAVLLVMAVSIPVALLVQGYQLPEMTLANLHPEGLPVWPFMCVTVACGAISGFHATQSPIISRCLKSERSGRRVFYGAMIAEAVIAMVWAAAGIAFYETTGGLLTALNTLKQSGVVYDVCTKLMGVVGGIIAIVGVVACPITSGDTAFRGTRLAIADWFGIDQKPFRNRLFITIPCFAVCVVLLQLDFSVIWRYFAWSNQTLAAIMLWAASAYLAVHAANRWYSLITALPAAYMTAVVCTYILTAQEGLRLGLPISLTVGIAIALAAMCAYLVRGPLARREGPSVSR